MIATPGMDRIVKAIDGSFSEPQLVIPRMNSPTMDAIPFIKHHVLLQTALVASFSTSIDTATNCITGEVSAGGVVLRYFRIKLQHLLGNGYIDPTMGLGVMP